MTMTHASALNRVCGLAAVLCVVACDAPKDDALSELDEMAQDVGLDFEESECDETCEAESGGESDDESGDSDDGEPEPIPPRAPSLEGPCEAEGEPVACTIDGERGTQFCDPSAEGWGPCLVEPLCQPGDIDVRDCFGHGEAEYACFLFNGVPEWEDCGFTPLVLSFDGEEPMFDAGSAAFELSAGDDSCWARQWPSAETPWLAIDLDHSGAIENGSELFGSATPTADGHRPSDGFEALAAYDQNADGQITADDAVWSELMLWSDHDRDRASSPWELVPLAYSGVQAVDLQFNRERICDSWGNCGIERSTFSHASGSTLTRGTVIDVHIPCD